MMKAKTFIAILLVMAMVLASQITAFATDGDNILYLQIGNQTLTASLVDNSATKALKESLAKNPITINMNDYGGFEKVGGLGMSFPANDKSITTEPGDLMLYQGNQLVVFYAPNTWSYTQLGKINNVTQAELKNILGNGNVTLTLSLNSFGEVPKTGVPDVASSVAIMTLFLGLSAALWVYILRCKYGRSNSYGSE